MRQPNLQAAAKLFTGLMIFVVLVCFPTFRANAEVRKIVRDTAAANMYPSGKGTPIGKVRSVYGEVLITHAAMDAVYSAQKDYPLYAGDTVTSRDQGHIVIVLNDDSLLTLAPGTTLVLNEAVFDPAAKKRTALMNLVCGKARFFVKKFIEFQNSTFTVQTKTSVAAVRGSDFIIEQIGDKTVITTLGMTVLSVTNLENPLAEPIIVNSMQQLIVVLGQLPGNPFNITAEELISILHSLGIPTGGDEGGDGGNEGGGNGHGGGGDDNGSPYNDHPISPYRPRR